MDEQRLKSEKMLVAEVLTGKREAFVQLVEQYQRLYKALAEEPEVRLANGFAASVIARISEIEKDSKADQIVNILALLAAAVGLVLLILYSAQYVTVDLSAMGNVLNSINLPSALVSQTWLYTGLVCGLIGWLDKYVITRSGG